MILGQASGDEMKFAMIEPRVVAVSKKTKWFFVKVTTADGIYGYGEATLFGWEPVLHAYLKIVADRLTGIEVSSARALQEMFPDRSGGKVSDSIHSALEQAFWDILGKELGKPVHALLGTRRTEVEFYANINRGTLDRTPEGWAARAAQACDAGFRAIKMAPLDGIRMAAQVPPDYAEMAKVMEKIAAVSQVCGDRAEVYVDCHWRLNVEGAPEILSVMADAGIRWFETPFEEGSENLGALAALRGVAKERGVMLAGAEMLYGQEGFRPMLDAGSLDVIMPDIRWCGGIEEGVRIGALAQRHGAMVAPHNSAGPILSAASLHLACATPALHSAELQFAESPLYFSILSENQVGLGQARVNAPTAPGLGVDLDEHLIASLPTGDRGWAETVGQAGASRFG
ncbi:mandelate racemase/muconate lactonizing enzyme family protein [Brucellaceae bacterium VT-16-1752]|nr:mandelate racemase/muconate lactonizing enzyme family protein [Brucellaceae bacterium VT-16-1752]